MENMKAKFPVGNRLILEGKYKEAINFYKVFLKRAPKELEGSALFNLNYSEKKLGIALSSLGGGIKDEPCESSIEIKENEIFGHLNSFRENSNFISGWACRKNSNEHVIVSVYIDGSWAEDLKASLFRKDLKEKKIGVGYHGYSMPIPQKYLDGKKHQVIIKEKESKIVCGSGSFCLNLKIKYTDFDGMQKNNLLDPIILAPFDENKKRSLAYMDVVEKSLSKKALDREKEVFVTVLMASYNREGLVVDAIRSVLSQSYQNFELIIGDDGSNDKTVTSVKSINDSRIKVIEFKSNRGKSAVLNDLFQLSKGDLIAYLDTDNTWEPGYLSSMVGAYLKTKAKVLYSAQYLYFGSSSKPYAVRYAPFNRNLLFNRNYIDHNSFIHHRSVFDKVGGYDPSIRRCLDYDFIVKAASFFRTVSVPVCQTNYYYDKSDNSITGNQNLSGDIKLVCERIQKNFLNTDRMKASYLEELNSCKSSKMTVVIPSYESLDDLTACIRAIDEMEERSDLSIVIVDNNSSENVKKYLYKLRDKAGVNVIFNDYNYGFTYAVNQGIAISDRDSDIVLLNNDALPISGSFRLLSKFCNFKDDVGAVVPAQILEPNTKTMEVHVPFANKNHYCDVNISIHHDNLRDVPLFADGEYYKIKFAPFFCVYIPRETINEIGVLDAELGRHYRSDRLYSNQIIKFLGKSIYYLPDALVIHRLQRATADLKRKENNDFDEMFKRNVWPMVMLRELGYKEKKWF